MALLKITVSFRVDRSEGWIDRISHIMLVESVGTQVAYEGIFSFCPCFIIYINKLLPCKAGAD